MKKFFWLTLILLLTAGTVFAQISANSNAWVSADSISLKSSAGFFASNVGVVAYGAQVSVLQVSGNWAQVRTQASPVVTGWISTGNLSSRRITGTGSGATASEVALAGKGFNQEVEDAYRTGRTLNYADIDRTERLGVSDDELLRFLRDGRLSTGEGR